MTSGHPPPVAVAVVLLSFFLPAARAEAQATAGRMVVLPFAGHADPDKERRVADLIEAGLAARGVQMVSMHDAWDRVQAQSRPPVAPDNSDLDVLAREARAAIEHVAFGRSAAAQRSVEEVFKRAERALESLNRETKTARNVLDACLALVRSTLARGERQDALAEAMRCRRLVPDVAPSEFSHPASVVGVLAEADNQLRRMRIGRLSVQSTPESGCSTYVNGRHLGVTPFHLDRAAEGEYRVQVECGSAPGRVHLVHLGDKPVELVVDAELDRALRGDGRVVLVYTSPTQARRLATSHGVEVARSVRAEELVLVEIVGKHADLTRLSVARSDVLGRARVPWLRIEGEQSSELDAALDALFQGRMEHEVAVTLAAPGAPRSEPGAAPASPGSAEASAVAAPGDQHPRRTRRLRIVAGALAASGAGLFLAGVAFEHQRAGADERLYGLNPADPADAPAVARAQDDYDRAARFRWLGIPGSALLTAAVPLLRVDVRRGVPWWSYAIGVVGLACATWGAVEAAKHGDCEIALTTGGCADQRESAGRGGLLLASAAPLLAFPIDHVLEWRVAVRRARVSTALAVGGDRVLLALRTELDTW